MRRENPKLFFMTPIILTLFLVPACGGSEQKDVDGMVADADISDDAWIDATIPDGSEADGAEPDGGSFVCDPPAEPGSIFELQADFKYEENPVSMCRYRGEVILIVNVAAACGYTNQFGDLVELQTTYESQGFTVLGFYCNQFMNQAGSPEQQETVETQYGVNFPVSEIINVNPPDEHPIYTWLKAQPGGDGSIGWNFVKFLVGRDGELLGRWDTTVSPTDSAIKTAIEEAL